MNVRAYALAIAIVVFCLAWVAGPLLVLWALNTLFDLALPYQLNTWFAVLILLLMMGPKGHGTKSQ